MLTKENNNQVHALAHIIEGAIDGAPVFNNASKVDQIEILDDLIGNLQLWRNSIYDKWDNENN